MAELDNLRGVALTQRGSSDLVAVAGGTTGGDPDTACTFSTRFQIASVTKQFTAAAVLLLADRGTLSVDDPVSRWIDGTPAHWDAVRLHHLLSNTGGVMHWKELPGLPVTQPVPVAEKLRIFFAAPLLSPPGERFSYSSPGYVILAHVIERASGVSYGAFMDREFFGPLAMTATFTGSGRGRPELAAGHKNGAPERSFELDTLGLGTGSIWSTAGDLARWDRALAAGEILSPAARQAMFTVHTPIEDDDGVIRTEGYGYGWFIGSVLGGHRVFYHPGDNPGFLAFNAWCPDDDVRAICLTNEDTTSLDPIVHYLARTAFG